MKNRNFLNRTRNNMFSLGLALLALTSTPNFKVVDDKPINESLTGKIKKAYCLVIDLEKYRKTDNRTPYLEVGSTFLINSNQAYQVSAYKDGKDNLSIINLVPDGHVGTNYTLSVEKGLEYVEEFATRRIKKADGTSKKELKGRKIPITKEFETAFESQLEHIIVDLEEQKKIEEEQSKSLNPLLLR